MSMAEGTPDLPYPKLPFWDTVSLAYSTYFHHFIDALRASWLWLAVFGAFMVLASWQQWSGISEVMANLKAGEPTQMPISTASVVFSGVEYILWSLAAVNIAVAWHRLIILNERPGFIGSNVATKDLWRYIVVALTLFLISVLPMATVVLPAYSLLPTTGPSAQPARLLPFMLLGLVLYAVGAAVAFRLTLLLPARAIGNIDLTFKQAWNYTRGNAWRLFWGSMVTVALPVLVSQTVFSFLIRPPPPSEAFYEDVVATMSNLLFLPIGIGFLSLAYRHFFQAPLQLPE
jgi:hypothetical protein